MAQSTQGEATLGPLAADLAAASLALAARFAAGATLWCWAPHAPEHAQHVAVEFVHPVIVGKRALPAVAIAAGAEALDALRPLVGAGDALMVVGGDAGERAVMSVLRRAPSWGAATIWLGSGERPGAGSADHLLWLDHEADGPGPDEASRARHDGRFVLIYHLLWELTHVCFEHPGLLGAGDAPCEGPVCTTCSDEGRLAEVVDAIDLTATVRTAAGTETIDTTLVGGVAAGDLVIVHAGTALTIVDERP